MAALIRQANSGYELASKDKDKNERRYGRREEREQNNDNNNRHFLARKKRQEMSASNVTRAGYT